MHYLAEREKDDPALVAEVRDKFCTVEEPFEKLHSKVLQRQARLQNFVIQSQDFQLSLREAQDQLNEYERNIAQLPPISAIYEEALQQKEDHEVRLVILSVLAKSTYLQLHENVFLSSLCRGIILRRLKFACVCELRKIIKRRQYFKKHV